MSEKVCQGCKKHLSVEKFATKSDGELYSRCEPCRALRSFLEKQAYAASKEKTVTLRYNDRINNIMMEYAKTKKIVATTIHSEGMNVVTSIKNGGSADLRIRLGDLVEIIVKPGETEELNLPTYMLAFMDKHFDLVGFQEEYVPRELVESHIKAAYITQHMMWNKHLKMGGMSQDMKYGFLPDGICVNPPNKYVPCYTKPFVIPPDGCDLMKWCEENQKLLRDEYPQGYDKFSGGWDSCSKDARVKLTYDKTTHLKYLSCEQYHHEYIDGKVHTSVHITPVKLILTPENIENRIKANQNVIESEKMLEMWEKYIAQDLQKKIQQFNIDDYIPKDKLVKFITPETISLQSITIKGRLLSPPDCKPMMWRDFIMCDGTMGKRYK